MTNKSRTLLWVAIILCNILVAGYLLSLQEIFTKHRVLDACFSPEGSCESEIINYINMAKENIFVHAYSFTSANIADAVLQQSKAGVRVQLIYDRGQAKSSYSHINKLKEYGIEAYSDRVSGLSHNKIIIIDNALVITGSYNWSKSANSRNAENVVFIRDSNLTRKYLDNWHKRFSSAKNNS